MTDTYILTTRTVSPTSDDLTTLEVWKDDWGLKTDADDAFIGRSITRCSVAAAQFCNRAFGIATYLTIFRLARGYRDGFLISGRQNPIMLPQWPIVSFTSVTETDSSGTVTTLVEGTDFEADYTTGKLYRLNSVQRPRDWWPSMEITVTYQAGYVLPGQQGRTLPVDIEDAVGRMVYSRYAERQRDPFLKAETVDGGGRFEYIVTTGADGGNLSPDVSDILNNYRQPVVA